VVSSPLPSDDEGEGKEEEEPTVSKKDKIVMKLLQIMNSIESKPGNCSIVLKKETMHDLLSVLNDFPFTKKFKANSLSGVVQKITLMFQAFNGLSESELISDNVSNTVTEEFLNFCETLMYAGLSWKKLLVDNRHFHSGLSKTRYMDAIFDKESLSFGWIIFDLINESQTYMIVNNEKVKDDDEKAAIATAQQNYISLLFCIFSTLDHTSNKHILSQMSQLFDRLLLPSTVSYYLEDQNMTALAKVLDEELKKLSITIAPVSHSNLCEVVSAPTSADSSTVMFLSVWLDMAIKIFQLAKSQSVGLQQFFATENGFTACFESLLGLLSHDLKCTAQDDVNGLALSTKLLSLLSLIMSIDSSFPVLFKEDPITKKMLASLVETVLAGIKLVTDSDLFVFTDFLQCALNVLFIVISNPANQQHLSLTEVLGLIAALNDNNDNDEPLSFFRDLLDQNRQKEKVVELVIQMISLFSDETICTQLFVDAVSDESSASGNVTEESDQLENDEESVLDLLLFLLSYYIKNEVTVEYGLSLLERWLHYHKIPQRLLLLPPIVNC
jgi:hypothetical protein